jgi:hypothetical protein
MFHSKAFENKPKWGFLVCKKKHMAPLYCNTSWFVRKCAQQLTDLYQNVVACEFAETMF